MTDLSEALHAISCERGIDNLDEFTNCSKRHLAVLCEAARRVQAMVAIGPDLAALRALELTSELLALEDAHDSGATCWYRGRIVYWHQAAQELGTELRVAVQSLLDLASDQAAARKRVGELEAELAAVTRCKACDGTGIWTDEFGDPYDCKCGGTKR